MHCYCLGIQNPNDAHADKLAPPVRFVLIRWTATASKHALLLPWYEILTAARADTLATLGTSAHQQPRHSSKTLTQQSLSSGCRRAVRSKPNPATVADLIPALLLPCPNLPPTPCRCSPSTSPTWRRCRRCAAGVDLGFGFKIQGWDLSFEPPTINHSVCWQHL
jgi:hypothetical protein